jgi:hypothetical protein
VRQLNITVLFGVALVCSFMLMSTPGVSADTISVSQTITVTAVIAPARYIIVNKTGIITSILSNSAQDVAPKVYLGNPQGVQQSLTPALQKKYESILLHYHGNKVGTIYSYKAPRLSDTTTLASLFKRNLIFY